MLLKNKSLPFVIFAAGKGTRAWPLTEKIPKVLLKAGGKPMICYALDTAKTMGAEEVFIVVEYKKEMIQKALGKAYGGLSIRYIIQENSEGLVHNVQKTGEVIDSDFVLLLGDEIYLNSRHKEFIPFYRQKNPDGVCGIIEVKEKELIKKNYSLEFSGRIISKLVEKPERVINNFLGCGTWVFKPSVFDFIKDASINPRTGKKELVDLIQTMINAGKIFLPFNLGDLYININTREDLVAAKRLLENFSKRNKKKA